MRRTSTRLAGRTTEQTSGSVSEPYGIECGDGMNADGIGLPLNDAQQDRSWLLRVPEAAALLGMSPAKVWALVAAGTLPSIKIAGSRRIRRDELWRWLGEYGG